MLAFFCPIPAHIKYGKFVRHYHAVVNADTPTVDRLYIHMTGEVQLIREYYEGLERRSVHTQVTQSDVTEVAQPSLKTVNEVALIAWNPFPARLGRMSAKIVSDKLQLDETPDVLLTQSRQLRSKKPNKKYFRFVVINAFGTNLGDTMMGMTAMRVVCAQLAQVFDHFCVDLALGLQSGAARQVMIGDEPWLGQVLLEAPTVQEMSRYDAYFDFTDPINQPRFGDMPTLDWYLWWMGLDPNAINVDRKRNSTTLTPDDWAQIEKILGPYVAKKLILFNPHASVPLRSCPSDIAASFCMSLLERWEEALVLIDKPLPTQHPRLIDLSAYITSPGLFQALVLQSTGLITVDTFSLHVADCNDVPTVLVSASVPASFFPYYPKTALLELPGARDLPEWGRTKSSGEDSWQKNVGLYRAAWQALDVDVVIDALKGLLPKQASLCNRRSTVRLESARKLRLPVFEESGHLKLRHERVTTEWVQTVSAFSQVSELFLKRGMTAALATCADAGLIGLVATRLGPLGHMHLFEARSLRARILSSTVHITSEMGNLSTYSDTLSDKVADEFWIAQTDPFSESVPYEWGNTSKRDCRRQKVLDDFALHDCDVLYVMPPSVVSSVIEGAKDLIQRHRPVILGGPMSIAEAQSIHVQLKSLGYRQLTRSLKDHSEVHACALLAVPATVVVDLPDFIEMKD
jgi:hypothetical protein